VQSSRDLRRTRLAVVTSDSLGLHWSARIPRGSIINHAEATAETTLPLVDLRNVNLERKWPASPDREQPVILEVRERCNRCEENVQRMSLLADEKPQEHEPRSFRCYKSRIRLVSR
jgi:hypothetical protein